MDIKYFIMIIELKNISTNKLVACLFELILWFALGGVMIFIYIDSRYHYNGEVTTLDGCIILILVLGFYILPLFWGGCAIIFYLYERKLIVSIDDTTLQMHYNTPNFTKVLVLKDVVSWKQYYNSKTTSLELNILEFYNGEIIMFSNLFSLQKYLYKQQKEFGLPEIDVIGSMFKYYKYLRFIREHSTKKA